MVVRVEIAWREDGLVRLAEAKAVLQAPAAERTAAEQAEYEAKLAQRAERERTTGRHPRGRLPTPPVPGARDCDQYNFSDPESRQTEKPTPCRLRPGLQCAGGRGSGESADRGIRALQSPQ